VYASVIISAFQKLNIHTHMNRHFQNLKTAPITDRHREAALKTEAPEKTSDFTG
jgi:hypothetical protein